MRLTIFEPETKSNHELLDSAYESCRLDDEHEGDGVAEQQTDQENVAQFTSGGSDNWNHLESIKIGQSEDIFIMAGGNSVLLRLRN